MNGTYINTDKFNDAIEALLDRYNKDEISDDEFLDLLMEL